MKLKHLILIISLGFSSIGAAQMKQLMLNGYNKVGVYPDLNISTRNDFSTNIGIGLDVTVGARFIYFLSFETGFLYNYHETKTKFPNTYSPPEFPNSSSNSTYTKRKYRYNSIGIPFEAKVFVPIDLSRSGATDFFVGYNATLMYNAGDNLLNVFENGQRNVQRITTPRFSLLHKALIGVSLNAGSRGDIDLALSLGFMTDKSQKILHYISLGCNVSYRIYWLEDY